HRFPGNARRAGRREPAAPLAFRAHPGGPDALDNRKRFRWAPGLARGRVLSAPARARAPDRDSRSRGTTQQECRAPPSARVRAPPHAAAPSRPGCGAHGRAIRTPARAFALASGGASARKRRRDLNGRAHRPALFPERDGRRESPGTKSPVVRRLARRRIAEKYETRRSAAARRDRCAPPPRHIASTRHVSEFPPERLALTFPRAAIRRDLPLTSAPTRHARAWHRPPGVPRNVPARPGIHRALARAAAAGDETRRATSAARDRGRAGWPAPCPLTSAQML